MNKPDRPPLPSPLGFVGAVLYGAVLGVMPGLFVWLGVEFGWLTALGVIGFVIVAAWLQDVAGWALVMAPIMLIGRLWRMARGLPPPAKPQQEAPAPQPRHWVLWAGFLSGAALTTLLFLRGAVSASEAV